MRPATSTISTVSLFLALFLALPGIVVARPLTIEDLFIPFEFLHVEDVYDRYSALIDLFIFTLIFVGLAEATLAHRFPGNGGRAMAIGVGLSLALAAVTAEYAYGISLKSLGPFAAALIMLILGVMVYRFLHAAGMSRTGAAGAAYIILFFGITAAAPHFFDWLNERMPIVSALAVLGLLGGLLALLSTMGAHGNPLANIERRWAASKHQSSGQQHRQAELKNETAYLKRGAKPAIKNELKNERQLENELRGIREAIKRHGNTPKGRQFILQELERTTASAEHVMEDIQRIWELNKRLLEFDTSLFNQDRARAIEAMSPEERAAAKQELHEEMRKLTIEQRLQELQTSAARRLAELRQRISETATLVGEGRQQEAIAAMESAIKSSQGINALSRETKTLEQTLLKLTKRQTWRSA